MIAQPVAPTAMTSISAPIDRMAPVSPLAMPRSTMSAISRGRYRFAIDWIMASPSTSATVARYGRSSRNNFSMVGSLRQLQEVVHPLGGDAGGARQTQLGEV